MHHFPWGSTLRDKHFVDDTIYDAEGFWLDYLKRRWCSGCHSHPLIKKVLVSIAGVED